MTDLKTYQCEAEVTLTYIYEVQAETPEQALELFRKGQCAYIGRGGDKRKIGKIEEVEG